MNILVVLLLIIFAFPSSGYAFWVWTPETNKWVNPKFSVKETPSEQLTYAKEIFEAGDYEIARKEFSKLLKHYPKSRESAEAQYLIGRCYEAQKNYADANKAYQLVIDKYPFSELAAEVVERQYKMAEGLLEGGDKKTWMQTVTGSDFQIVEIFRAVIKNAPYGKYAAPAQYKIGLYLKEKSLYQEARDEFEKTMNDYPGTEWAKAAKYQVAVVDSIRSSKAQYDQNVTSTAVEEFQKFLKEHPETELSDQAKDQIKLLRDKEAENGFLIGEFYEKQKRPKSAKIYYDTVINDYSDTIWAAKALERIRSMEIK